MMDGDILEARRAQLHSEALWWAIRKNAVRCARYALEHGAPMNSFDTSMFPTEISTEILELLLAHEWDINDRQKFKQPLLWHICGNTGLVRWCLDHGAEVIPRNQDPDDLDDTCNCPPLLDLVARRGTVEGFALLRSKGAPLGRCAVHHAARRAIFEQNSDKDTEQLQEEQDQAMEMLRYLVDDVKLDVNATDHPPNLKIAGMCGTPLCYVASWPGDREIVVRFLLAHGADPAVQDAWGLTAIDKAKNSRDTKFLEVVSYIQSGR